MLYVSFSVKCLKFVQKLSNSYFQPILVAIFLTIPTVKVKLIPYGTKKVRKDILKLTLSTFPTFCICLLKQMKLPISVKLPVNMWELCIFYLNYIIKFDFMNNIFANLLLAWL